MPARPGRVCTLIWSTFQGEPQLQIFEKRKWVTVLFRVDGACRVIFPPMVCFLLLFMQTGKRLSPFSFDSFPVP